MKRSHILCIFWHRIDSDSTPPEFRDGTNPTTSLFRHQIEFIRRNYTPISVRDFLKANGQVVHSYAKPPVLLGFDDGFKSVIVNGLPILSEFGIPAVFFVIGETVRNPEFVPWFVEVLHILRKARGNQVVYRDVQLDMDGCHDRARLRHLVVGAFRASRSQTEREGLLTDLAMRLGVRRPVVSELDEDLRLVESRDLTALGTSSLLTIGSHAMTHRHLASLSYGEQLEELQQSDSVLRQHCPSYCPVVAYPSGSFSTTTIAIARQIYEAGFAVLLGSSYRNPYAYPRVGIGQSTVDELRYAVSPIRLNYLLPLKRLLHVLGIRKAQE